MSTLDAIIMAGSALDAADTLAHASTKVVQAFNRIVITGEHGEAWSEMRALYVATLNYEVARERQIRIAEASLAE